MTLASVPKSIPEHYLDSILCHTSPRMDVDVHAFRHLIHTTAVLFFHAVANSEKTLSTCWAVRCALRKCLPQGIPCP